MRRKYSVGRSLELYERALHCIPGGTHLFGRRAELAAYGVSPIYSDRQQGGHFWDVDGSEYIDLLMGSGAVILGHAYPTVVEAVQEQAARGTGLTLNHPLEVDLAELLVEVVPCAEMVRFCKGGGEANTIAVRIARGATGRDKIIFCGYHGWHDWYLAANLADEVALNEHLMPGISPTGVPRVLQGTALSFEYNNLGSLQAVLEANQGEVAAVIMEAARSSLPEPGFLQGVRELTERHGVVLIFDEVVTGFRLALGGAQEYFGVLPDMATYAKTLSNGFALGAVVGKREVMEPARDMFISSVYWAEATGLAAGLASVRAMRDVNPSATVWALGKHFMNSMNQLAERLELPFTCAGLPPFPFIRFTHENAKLNQELTTLYIQEMARRGVFAYTVNYFCFEHSQRDLYDVLEAVGETFDVIAKALQCGDVKSFLECPVRQADFRRLV